MEKSSPARESKKADSEEVLFGWQAPGRPYRASGKFLTLPMVIGILLGIILLFAGEWMLIAVIAALVFAYYAWTVLPAETVNFSLTSEGIKINADFFPWQVMTRWWETEKWGHNVIVVEVPNLVSGRIFMPTGNAPLEKIELVMNSYLKKETPKETSTEKMGRWLAEKFPLEDGQIENRA